MDYSSPLDIYIGYDEGEAVAYHACVNSLIRTASQPLRITPLALNNLAPLYSEKHTDGSTTFAYSRFLCPYISGYTGMSLYLDGDMIVKDDIAKLFEQGSRDMNAAVFVVKHPDYTPKSKTKLGGAAQNAYPRKNWSSVMLFRNSSSFCKQLTPEYVSKMDGKHLHQFEWVDDERVSALSPQWNHLVGEYPHNDEAKILHYTEGVPAFEGYASCDHATEWWDEVHRITHVD